MQFYARTRPSKTSGVSFDNAALPLRRRESKEFPSICFSCWAGIDGAGLKRALMSAAILVTALGTWLFGVNASGGPGNRTNYFRAYYTVHNRSEDYILTEINRIRKAKGLDPLKLNSKLQEVARRHSLDMSSLNYFSHEDLDGHDVRYRLASARVGWKRVGENIAKCRSSDPARTALAGWLDSPGHRRNILDQGFKETGIGAVVDPEGEVSFCQIFMTR